MNPLAIAILVAAVVAMGLREWWEARRAAARRPAFGSQAEGRRYPREMAALHEDVVAAEPEGPWLDARTAADLYLDEVLLRIDHTRSAVGRQWLYHRLRNPRPTAFREADRQLAQYLTDDPAARQVVERALARVTDAWAFSLWEFARPDAIPAAPWFAVFPVLGVGALVATVAIPFWPPAVLVLVTILGANLFVRAAAGWRISSVVGPLRQVGPLLRAAEELLGVGAVAEAASSRLTRADLGQLTRLRRTARWIGRDPTAQGEVTAILTGYLNFVFLLDANALFVSARELRRRSAVLRRVIAGVGEIDVVYATASLALDRSRWSRPEFVDRGPFDVAGAGHPLLEEPVPNSIRIEPGTGVILTGANMSGKTTFIRTMGLAALLAQTIDLCPAARYRAPWVRVRSCIGRADDLLAGKSYYQAEVEAVLDLVRSAEVGPPHLLLFDELFRGTNTIERLAAGEAVLVELTKTAPGGRHFIIVATHDGELVGMVTRDYRPWHFG
ncbi:MAG: hypothetical protein AB7L66_17140, partial [Gemmatimonadales bacterium]